MTTKSNCPIIYKGRPLPLVFIAGAMRSGTTSLYYQLKSHPRIHAPAIVEPRYFDRYYDNGDMWYVRIFRGLEAKHSYAMDGTPSYLQHAQAMQRIAARIDQPRILVSLREPAARAYSHYLLNRARGAESRSFEIAVDDEMSNRSTTAYVSHGLYVHQLQRAEAAVGRDRIHVLFLEEFSQEPARALRNVWSFLGLPSVGDMPPAVRVNSYTTFRSLMVRRFTHRLPKRLGNLIGKMNSRATTPPALAPSTRVRLVDYYLAANEQLAAHLGRPLPW